jgi:hypothetical protein
MFAALTTDEAHMSSPRLIRRLLRAPATASPVTRHPGICPPAPWQQPDSVWHQLCQWLSSSPDKTPRSHRQLVAARQDCAQALCDLDGQAARDLALRCHSARSLRELWHLRAEVYSLVARELNQGEADRRLQTINRHYHATVVAPRNTTQEQPHA